MRRHEKTTRSQPSPSAAPRPGSISVRRTPFLRRRLRSFLHLGTWNAPLPLSCRPAPPRPAGGAPEVLLRKPAGRGAPLRHGDGWGPAALLPLRLLLLREPVRGALRAPRALPGRAAAAPGLRPGEWLALALRRSGRQAFAGLGSSDLGASVSPFSGESSIAR